MECRTCGKDSVVEIVDKFVCDECGDHWYRDELKTMALKAEVAALFADWDNSFEMARRRGFTNPNTGLM